MPAQCFFQKLEDGYVLLFDQKRNIGLYINPQDTAPEHQRSYRERAVLCEFAENPLKTKKIEIRQRYLSDTVCLGMLADGTFFGFGFLKSVEDGNATFFISDQKGSVMKFTFNSEPSPEINAFEKEYEKITGEKIDAAILAGEGSCHKIDNDSSRLFMFSRTEGDWALFFNTLQPLALFKPNETFMQTHQGEVVLGEMEWNGPNEIAGHLGYSERKRILNSVSSAELNQAGVWCIRERLNSNDIYFITSVHQPSRASTQ